MTNIKKLEDIITLYNYITTNGKYPEMWDLANLQENKQKLENAKIVVEKNLIFWKDFEYKHLLIITSGARTPERTARVGGAKGSKHNSWEGIDLGFPENDPRLLKASHDYVYKMVVGGEAHKLGLYFEHRYCTKYWNHCQTVPARSQQALIQQGKIVTTFFRCGTARCEICQSFK